MKKLKIINNVFSNLTTVSILSILIFIIFSFPAFAQPISSDRFVRSAVERALKRTGNQQIEIIAQGSWISGQNYKDPRFKQMLPGVSDHDMRVFFRSQNVTQGQALEMYKNFRMNVQEELRGFVERGLISAEEHLIIRNSINIYPPEELMKGVESADDALRLFNGWGIYPSLAEAGKEGAGGSYGKLLRFERQAFETGPRVKVFYLDNGEVRSGAADLNHMLEGHGLGTPEGLAKAAEENIDNALHGLNSGSLKDTQKYVERAAKRLKAAKTNLKVKLSPNDEALLKLDEKLRSLWKKYEAAETRTALLSDEILAKSPEDIKLQQMIKEEFKKLSGELEKVLKESLDDSYFLQKLAKGVEEAKPAVSSLFRGILEAAGPKWANAAAKTREGMGKLGDAAKKIGFLNALVAYWTIKDLPEIYVNKGAGEATARFSMSLASMAVPELAIGELVAVIATSIAELAVDYVGYYGYKAAVSRQDCFDLIDGFYTVAGRETQVLEEGITKCHKVSSLRQLSCDIYDENDLQGYIQRTQKIDPKLIPSKINSLIACHAKNACQRAEEAGITDKKDEEALIGKCTGPVLTAWIEQREMGIEEVKVLASEIERSELRITFNASATEIKENAKGTMVRVSAELLPSIKGTVNKLKEKLQCIGGKASKPYVYQNFVWKQDGIKAGSTTEVANYMEFSFQKKGRQTICIEGEIEYGLLNTPNNSPPADSSGKLKKASCVDIEITEELKSEKIIATIMGSNKAKAPDKGETGKDIPLTVDLKTKRDIKEFSFVWTHEGGYSGGTAQSDQMVNVRYEQPGSYEIKVEVYDRSDTWKVKEIKSVKLAEAKHKITIEPSVKDAKIELKITGPDKIVIGDTINLSVEVIADQRIKAKLKSPVWYMSRGGQIILSPDDEDPFSNKQSAKSIGQGINASYKPIDSGEYRFRAEVFGEGVSGAAASASKEVYVDCKIVDIVSPYDSSKTIKTSKCDLEEKEKEEKLSIMLMPDRTSVTSGEKININAVAKGGSPPYSFIWTGKVEGGGPSVTFIPSKNDRTITVEVKDAKGQTAKESITFNVDTVMVPLEGLKDKVVFGTWLDVRVPVESDKWVLWQSSPNITFKDQETPGGQATTVTFDRMDKVKVWADVRVKKGEVYETVASTEQYEVNVLPFDARIEFDPSTQKIGRTVDAQVKITQPVNTSTVKYVWIDPPTSNKEMVTDYWIRFTVRDEKPVPIEVELRSSRANETIVNLKRPYDYMGRPSETTISSTDDTGKKAKRKDAAANLEKAKSAVSEGKLDEGVTLAEEAVKIDSTFTEATETVKKWKAEKDTVAKQLLKVKELIAASRFVDAEKELAVAQNLHPKYPPVVDAAREVREKKDAYNRIIAASNEKLTKAKESVSQGKLDEGIKLAEEAAQINKANTGASAYAAKLKTEQTFVAEKAGNCRAFTEQERFAEAEKAINEAKRLHPLYQPVVDADTFFKTKKAAYEKKIKDSNDKLNNAKLDVRKGKLDEAIRQSEEAAVIFPGNKEALTYAAKLKKERETVVIQIDKTKKLISESLFADAQKELIVAQNLHGNYKPVTETLQMLGDAWRKYDSEVRDRLYEVRSTNERKEFQQALDKAKKMRETMKLYGYNDEQLRQQENWAKQWKAQKDRQIGILKSAGEKVKNYDYTGALKAYEEGFANSQNIYNGSEPEYKEAMRLRDDAYRKNKRLGELTGVIMSAAENKDPYYSQTHVLTDALKAVDEAIVLQPNNEQLRRWREQIIARAEKTRADNERIAAGRKCLDAARSAESSYSTNESYIQAKQLHWGEQLELQQQVYLKTAIQNYTESLKYIPDTNIEKKIKELRTTLEGRKKFLENYRQYIIVRKEADALNSQAYKEPDFEKSLSIYDQAIEKYKKCLSLYTPADAETVSRQMWNLDYSKHDRMVKKYWADGQAMEQAGRIVDAISVYDKAIASFHSTVPQNDRMWIIVHQQDLKNRVNSSKSWRADGEARQKQGNIAEAIKSYKQSVKLLPDAALEAHIKSLEGQLTAENAKKNTADKLWTEGSNLYKQGNEKEALTKFKESLGYWSNAERTKYVQDLENRIAQKKALCKNLWDEGNKLQIANRIADALVKFREYQKNCPTNEIAQHIQKLEAKLKEMQENESKKAMALKLRQEGDTFIKQNMIGNAIARYRQSLRYWPDPELEKYIQTLEARLAAIASTQQSNTGRSYTSKQPIGQQQVSAQQFYGEYNGTATGGGAIGKIAIIISNKNEVTGTTSGTLDGDPYSASIRGTFDPSSGTMQATFQGNVAPKGLSQKYPFTGSMSGKYQNCVLSGQWKGASSYGNPTGAWSVAMQKPFCAPSATISSGSATSPVLQKSRVIFEINNNAGVMNNPSRASSFTIQSSYHVTLIQNYHWNNGKGTVPGNIALRDQTGRTFGPWRTSGLGGQGIASNTSWVCHPNATIPAGNYTVVDSDPATWAHNSASGNRGFTKIEGYPVQGK